MGAAVMSDAKSSPVISQWLAEPVPREVAQALDRLARADDIVRMAVLPDVHLASGVCIGTVLATRRLLYPDAVGGDIGCGMAALRFDGSADALSDERHAARLLQGLADAVPVVRHSRATAPEKLPAELGEAPLSDAALEKLKSRDGRVEFATLGRGNHFVELQADEQGGLWAMLHTGSRAMGQAIRAAHLQRARSSNARLPFLDAETAEGRAYLADVAWACLYAERSREQIARRVADVVHDVLGAVADPGSWISCHHNHVRRELHFDSELWVHRKGAVPAREGEPGIIPGSMGSPSFHTSGRGCPESLASSSHGAGRAMRRGEAFRRIGPTELAGEMRGIWFDRRLTARLCDEAPSAYKDIGRVMRAQRDLTRIVRKLRPLLSFKGV
jgi:tRNA-splicing ligase RtcB (3'-phosphate/5'-hydroxy nucleic acid ligase)